MGKTPVWVSWAVVLGLVGAGCDDEPCVEVANLLRECCAKGPVELSAGCEAEAQRLESDGNERACEIALDEHHFDGCKR